jgi:hypothetical protein
MSNASDIWKRSLSAYFAVRQVPDILSAPRVDKALEEIYWLASVIKRRVKMKDLADPHILQKLEWLRNILHFALQLRIISESEFEVAKDLSLVSLGSLPQPLLN